MSETLIHLRLYPNPNLAQYEFTEAVKKAPVGSVVYKEKLSISPSDKSTEERFTWANSHTDMQRFLGLPIAELSVHEDCSRYVHDWAQTYRSCV